MKENEKMYGTMFVLFILSMAFATGFVTVDKLKGVIGMTVIPPTLTQPGLIQAGDTLDRTFEITPTADVIADYDQSDGFETILKKTITVWKWGEATPRNSSSIQLLSVSSTTPETLSITYRIPLNETDGTFFVTMVITKSDWQLTDRANGVWSLTNSKSLGTETETYLLGTVPGPTPTQITQMIQQVINLVMQQICATNTGWCK